MSQGIPSDEHAALSPCEIVALAEEMNNAGFPEIAEVLIGLAYDLADRSEADAMSARLIEKDCPADSQSGGLRG